MFFDYMRKINDIESGGSIARAAVFKNIKNEIGAFLIRFLAFFRKRRQGRGQN